MVVETDETNIQVFKDTNTPHIKYLEQSKKYSPYSHKRKKSHKETFVRTRSLLYLIEKLITLQEAIENKYNGYIDFSKGYYQRIQIILKVLT
jgi:hypothetical protein